MEKYRIVPGGGRDLCGMRRTGVTHRLRIGWDWRIKMMSFSRLWAGKSDISLETCGQVSAGSETRTELDPMKKPQCQITLSCLQHLLFVLVFIISITGCTSHTATMFPTEIQVSTLTPSLTKTITPSYDSSSVPAIQTSTPITPVATYSPDGKGAYLIGLIESNGGCHSPCFLGIQPGVSNWEEIRKVEAPLYTRDRYIPDDQGTITLYTYIEKKVENLDVVFFGSQNIIEQITVDARIYLPNDPYEYFPAFADAMRRYSLPNILSEFGSPSRVLLQVQGQIEQNAGTQAEILLLYDSLGFIVHYLFKDIVTQDQETFVLRACPDYEHTESIRLYLQASDNDAPLERMINNLGDYYLNTWLKPLQGITNLSVDDFHKMFVSPSKDTCFDIH
jgi:hypothetical protein